MSKIRGLSDNEWHGTDNGENWVRHHNSIYNYSFLSLDDIINQFIVVYVGDDKIIPKARRVDIAFHAQRALQELSYDTLKSILSQEIIVPASLKMELPHNYVNYVKLTWSDASGIEHVILPAIKTSNPIKVDQDPDDLETYNYTSGSQLKTSLNSPSDVASSTTWENYKSATPSENQKDDYNYDDDNFSLNIGQRYGLDPRHAQVNGSFYIDEAEGNIHFSSNISGKTVILKYISDGLTRQHHHDLKVNVHKFAEEAMYKQMLYAVLSGSALPIHQQLVPRFKKEAFAAKRNAKLRLSNIKIEEIAQVMRSKSKILKH
jgi:hypothetical protein